MHHTKPLLSANVRVDSFYAAVESSKPYRWIREESLLPTKTRDGNITKQVVGKQQGKTSRKRYRQETIAPGSSTMY